MTTDQFNAKIAIMLKGIQDGGRSLEDAVAAACAATAARTEFQQRFLNEAEQDFILPKAVLSAVLLEMADQYAPEDKAGKKRIKDIKPMVRIYHGDRRG